MGNELKIFGSSIASLGFIGPPPKFRSPLDTKASGFPLIYLVGPLAISDPHINICVGPLTLAFIVSKGRSYLPPPFLHFLEIQDVATFYRPIGKTKVLNESSNRLLYKFYPQSILILEKYLLKWWNANLICCLIPSDVFWSILWKMGIS